MFFLMLLAGLEMDAKEIRRAGKYAIALSFIESFITFVSGTLVAKSFGLRLSQSLFIGLLLSITAASVSALVLIQFVIMRTRLGNVVITAAVVNDMLSSVMLSVVIQISAESVAEQQAMDVGEVALSEAKMAAMLAGEFLFDLLLRNTSRWLPPELRLISKSCRARRLHLAYS